MFMELHINKKPIFVNVNTISAIVKERDQCAVFQVAEKDDYFIVDESYDTVRERIEYLCKKK